MNKSEKNISNLKSVIFYRLCVCILAWIGILIRIYIAIIEIATVPDPLLYINTMFSFYTIQTNVIVGVWLIIAILFNKREKPSKLLHSIIHGAICLYITSTFLIFSIFLSPFYKPTGIEAIANILLHYITPIAFIIEWIITESETQYKYHYLIYYTIYPFIYLFYVVIRGYFVGLYPYYFFDLNSISVLQLVINVILLVLLYTVIGSIYIFINRKIYKFKKED